MKITLVHRRAGVSTAVRAQSQQDKWNKRPGVASATVQVVGPQINSLVPFSAVTPVAGSSWVGENFGNLTGAILIHLTDYLGHPLDRPLQNLQWGDFLRPEPSPTTSLVFSISRRIDAGGAMRRRQQSMDGSLHRCRSMSQISAYFMTLPARSAARCRRDQPTTTHVKIKDAAIFRRNADAARTGRLVAGISATWRAITISAGVLRATAATIGTG